MTTSLLRKGFRTTARTKPHPAAGRVWGRPSNAPSCAALPAPTRRSSWWLWLLVLVMLQLRVGAATAGPADGTGGGSGRELQGHYDDGEGDDGEQELLGQDDVSSSFAASRRNRTNAAPHRNRPEPTKCEAAGYHNYAFDNDPYLLQQKWDGDGPRPPKKRASPSCKSATTNARGTYTTHQVPCTFIFYVAPHAAPPKANSLSDACTDANLHPDSPTGVDVVEQYVVQWPDECVGTFARCYRTLEDEKVMLRFLCKHPDFVIPKGTTHVRVDCTANEQLQIAAEATAERNIDQDDGESGEGHPKSFLRHAAQRQRELIAALFLVLALCLAAGGAFTVGAYRYALQPCLATMLSLKQSRSDSELSKLVAMGSGGCGDGDCHPHKRESASASMSSKTLE